MFIHPLHETLMVIMPSQENETPLLQGYANILDGFRNPRVLVFRNGPEALSSVTGSPAPEGLSGAALPKSSDIGLLLADWGDDAARLPELLRCADRLDVPALFVRSSNGRLNDVKRILVATAGGPHTLQQMWIAKEIANALKIPVRVVRIALPDENETAPVPQASGGRREAVVEHWTSRLLGIGESRDVTAQDVAESIAQAVQPDDLLVMGAPAPFHIAGGLDASTPISVASKISGPLILVHSRRPRQITLRNLFWGRLIQPRLYPPDGQRPILELLVDALIRHNQAPPTARSDLVERALRRERVMSTAVDCETAFPHIRLPGFRGITACMAICPDGVIYGGPGAARVKFFFLLVTPDGFCDDYLAVLGRIARRMLRPEVREALLGCAQPQDALDILEPRSPEILT